MAETNIYIFADIASHCKNRKREIAIRLFQPSSNAFYCLSTLCGIGKNINLRFGHF